MTDINLSEQTDDGLVSDYILLRDAKSVLKKKFEAESAKYQAIMDKIAQEMLARLNERGSDSTKTQFGTAYKQTVASATMQDREAFLAYVRENEAWDLITNHVSKEAVEGIIEATKAPPPGVNVDRRIVVNFRRA